MQDNIVHLHSQETEPPEMVRVLSKEAEQYEFRNVIGPLFRMTSHSLLFALIIASSADKDATGKKKELAAEYLPKYERIYSKAADLFLEYIASTVEIVGEPTKNKQEFSYFVTETSRLENRFERVFKTVPRMLAELELNIQKDYEALLSKHSWDLFHTPDYLHSVLRAAKLIEDIKAARDEEEEEGQISRYKTLIYNQLISQGELLLEDMIMGAFDLLTACSEVCLENIQDDRIQDLLLNAFEEARVLQYEANDYFEEISARGVLNDVSEEGDSGAVITPFPSPDKD